MGKNKNATLRYQAMDKCFSDHSRHYTYDDIDAAVRKSYINHTGIENSVSRQAFYNDIDAMESLYDCTIERIRDGKYTYFQYADPEFSLSNAPLKPDEEKLIQDTVQLLSRFEGLPNYSWISKITARLSTEFSMPVDSTAVVSFEENVYLKGMDDFFTPLFNAAINKQVVQLEYKPFTKDSAVHVVHPYMLKQYNNRWYLIGLNDHNKSMMHLAIDRIVNLQTERIDFIENTIDLEERFEDAIGITVPYDKDPVHIVLEVSNELFPYIETKPINGSQKVISRGDQSTCISIHVYDTYELRSFILSKGKHIKVIEPQEIAVGIKHMLQDNVDNYRNV